MKTKNKPSSNSKPPKRHKNPQLKTLIKNPNPNNLLPTIISTLKNPENPQSNHILKSCTTILLNNLQSHQSSSSSPSPSPLFLKAQVNTILALIPTMLCRREIIGTVAKIIACMSIVSFEVNYMISNDTCLLKALILGILGCGKLWDVKMDLVEALLDVCVTGFGRRRLIEISGLDYVMLGFLQVRKSGASPISATIMEKDGALYLAAGRSQDKLPLLLLNAVVTLTNFCNTEQLKNIPRKLTEELIPYWKEIWSNVHKQLLASKVINHTKHKCYYLSNVTVYNLAESIFRLSMYCSGPYLCDIPSDNVIDHLFGTETLSLKKFMLEHWESSPFLLRKRLEGMDSIHGVFSSFMHSLTSEESIPGFLTSLLQGMISCPPIALDEIDGLNFLNDVKGTLGCPLIYQQDIRVVKTNLHSKIENHYFEESSSKGMEASRPFSVDDILKCLVAYKEGYTVAIRGMESRVKSIATFTQLLASLFGQPSVGANLYVTPPDSQGLACHCDDHCVFICQLRGSKEWNVFSQPVVQLPRLYEQLEVPQELLTDSRTILLREGDVLYIPRGFAHEARTVSDLGESSNSKFSAHLTLAIEVEPPFEWEGFAHVALHGWSQGNQTNNFASDTSGILRAIYVNFLHVAIRLISHTEPLFRKACLVAANSFLQETTDWLEENQRAVFNQVITKVHKLANYTDSVNFVKNTLQQSEDPFQWLRWLEHLSEKDVFHSSILYSDLSGISKIISCIDEDKAKAEAAFDHLKSQFCDEVVFNDAKELFKNLQYVYRDGRVQFMNGMLSLHY